MRLHHLNCITTCPLGGKLMDARSESIFERGHLACHCVLVETGSELVLVDTGLGLHDVANPPDRLSRFFLDLVAPEFREEMTARRQIERMGFRAEDVRHIILTHLDFDHAGGLDDFPEARIHLMRSERDAAMAQRTWLDRQRFRPQQWSSIERWQLYRTDHGEDWYGFDCVRGLHDVAPEILMIPLIGHTLGHAGVAIQRDSGDWLLLAGDAYFFHQEMDIDTPYCTPGLRIYQALMDKDRRTRLTNQERLRELLRAFGDEVAVACSHDPTEFERLAGRPLDQPVKAPPQLDSETEVLPPPPPPPA